MSQEDIDKVARRLKLGRKALGLSAAELCRMVGCKPNTYSQWESGRGAPRLDQAIRLRSVLGYSLDWLFTGDRASLPMKLATALAQYENTDDHAPRATSRSEAA